MRKLLFSPKVRKPSVSRENFAELSQFVWWYGAVHPVTCFVIRASSEAAQYQTHRCATWQKSRFKILSQATMC